jgi:hypothetical protein
MHNTQKPSNKRTNSRDQADETERHRKTEGGNGRGGKRVDRGTGGEKTGGRVERKKANKRNKTWLGEMKGKKQKTDRGRRKGDMGQDQNIGGRCR